MARKKYDNPEDIKGGSIEKLKKDQVKGLNETRVSAERTEAKLRSMGEELDLKKKTEKQLKKDFEKNKNPIKKAEGGIVRGAGIARKGVRPAKMR